MGRAGRAGTPDRGRLTRVRAAGVLAVAALAAAAVTGCGSGSASIDAGGEITGEVLTVYSLLPFDGPGAATVRDLIEGEKLALSQSGASIGTHRINFASRDLGTDPQTAAESARTAMRDPAAIAFIGDLDSRTPRVTAPLLNEAGMLHLSPGATYTGFYAPVPGGPAGEPDRWRPSGRRTFAPLAPVDAEQAVAIAGAARGRVAVEAEATDASEALARAVRSRLPGRLVDRAAKAQTAVYAGEDVESAIGVVEGILREAPRARILLPEALLRGGLPARLPRSAAARVRYLSSATPAPPVFARDFERAFGRCPGPYAHVGFEAMRRVLDAIRRAGSHAGRRQAVIDAYFARPNVTAGWVVATGAPAGCPAP
jgi:branched-chain amino acid transport system substrate-binding protein